MAHSLTKTHQEKVSSSPSLFLQALGLSFLIANPFLKRNRKILDKVNETCELILFSQNTQEARLWKYRDDLPEDFDTTSLYLYLLKQNESLEPETLARYLVHLRAHRHESGAFYTWIGVQADKNEIDLGTNLSIQHFLTSMGANDSLLNKSLPNLNSLYYSEDFIPHLHNKLPDVDTSIENNIFRDRNSLGSTVWIQSPFVSSCIRLSRKLYKIGQTIHGRRSNDINHHIYTTCREHLEKTIAYLTNVYPDKKAELEGFLLTLPKLEKSHYIIKARVILFSKKVHRSHSNEEGLSRLIDQCLGALYGWMLFTLLDDEIDNKKPSTLPHHLLHLTTLCLRHFGESGVAQEYTGRILSRTIEQLHSELTNTKRGIQKLATLAWKKSFAQSIGLFYEKDTETLIFWKYYTLIKQLSDDMHDIDEDIRGNKATLPNTIYLINQPKGSNYALYTTLIYFSKTIRTLCKKSLRHYSRIPKAAQVSLWRKDIERTSINTRKAQAEFVQSLRLSKEIKKYSRVY